LAAAPTSAFAVVVVVAVALELELVGSVPILANPGSGPVTNVGATTSGFAASRAAPTTTRNVSATPITTAKKTTGVCAKSATKRNANSWNARRIEPGRSLATCTRVRVSRTGKVPGRLSYFREAP
jgi:hypothetical protein